MHDIQNQTELTNVSLMDERSTLQYHSLIASAKIKFSFCRYVQGNQIETLEGIEVLSQLQVLNISHNQLKALQGISLLPRLNTLICASNKLQGSKALQGLDACVEITTLDIQDNKLDDQEVKILPLELFKFIPILSGSRSHRTQ